MPRLILTPVDVLHPTARGPLATWLRDEATPSKELPIFPGRTATFHALPGLKAARIGRSETVATLGDRV